MILSYQGRFFADEAAQIAPENNFFRSVGSG
jgi:hypothetical protein